MGFDRNGDGDPMAQPPPPPPEDETVVADDWAVRPEGQVVVDETTVRRPRRAPTIWPWLLALLLLVLGGLGAYFFLTKEDDDAAQTTTVARAEVPRVIGLEEAPAEERVREADLEPVVERKPSAEPKGVVFAQAPAAGRRVERGEEVVLSVSEGPQEVAVPDVVGTTSSEATAALREAGFDANLVSVPSDQPAGTVIAQSPAAGTELSEGETVRLNVARAAGGTTTEQTTTGAATTEAATTQAEPRRATVPEAVGKELAVAAREFADAGLEVAVQYVPSNEPAGRVVAQAQPAGTERRRGDTVQLNVSIGAEPAAATSVPDVVGLRNAVARGDLERAGFEVLALSLDGRIRNESVVASQTPAGGASIPRGSLVLLYLRR